MEAPTKKKKVKSSSWGRWDTGHWHRWYVQNSLLTTRKHRGRSTKVWVNTESPHVLVNGLVSTGTNLSRQFSPKLPNCNFCPAVFLQPLDTHM